MTARVTLDDREVRAALAALARLGRDPSPALKALRGPLIASVRNRIVAQKTPDGVGFAALSARYAARKPRRWKGILRVRAMVGGLFGSFTSQVEGKVLRFGTNQIHAATHQFGRGAIPARPFLGISAEDRETIQDVFADFARRATARGA